MIVALYIKDFAIVKSLELDLEFGMTALTGETGAGKSIIIDALNLVLGGRAESGVVRTGASQSELTAVFDLTNIPEAQQWLQQQELGEAAECIIRRIIKEDGRSRSMINGTPCPQQLVRALGELLVNIHGQNEQHGLVRREQQRELLDNFAKHQPLLTQLCEIFTGWKRANLELERVETSLTNYHEKSELLNYQLQELDELALQQNELEELHGEHKQLMNSEQLLQSCKQAIESLENGELATANNSLAKFADCSAVIANAVELIKSAVIQIQEASADLQQYLTSANLNPERLQWVEERLNKIYDLARKHRVQPEQMFDLQETIKESLRQLENAHDRVTELRNSAANLSAEYRSVSERLTMSRKRAAVKFSEQIVKKMQLLNMPHADFKVDIGTLPGEKFSAVGSDEIEFLVTTNPDQPLRPLSKVASGGELSRISLAIQVITAHKSGMPTLIFDEIDTGIGGKTAQIVGQLLQQLGANTQVFCITHLPQVAVHAHNHLLVGKQVIANATHSKVKILRADEREQEIARMLSGAKITTQTLAHAKEMLADAMI